MVEDASTTAFRVGLGVGALLVIAGGILALVAIERPRRSVPCEECPGGAIVGAPEDVGQHPVAPRDPAPA